MSSPNGPGSTAPLVIHVCGLSGDPKRVTPLLDTLADRYGWSGKQMFVYDKQVRLFSRTGLVARAAALNDWIQARWQEAGRPTRVILMGHSIGGLLARSAYLQAREANSSSTSWVTNVERIVLFASPNSGFYLSRLRWYAKPIAYVLAAMLRGYLTPERSQRNRFAAVDSLAGSPFVTNLRIGWIRAEQEAAATSDSSPLPLTVQLLGYADALVEREDSREIERSSRNAHIAIEDARHEDIISITEPNSDRTHAILTAIGGDVAPTDPIDLPANEQGITSVVLLVHGIRAGIGGWDVALTEQLQLQMSNVMPYTVSYGFYSALKFAVPIGHQKNFRKFAERYSYLFARHPDAEFHLVAHSNGTFVSGWVLRAIDQMHLTRIFLAGSVLPEDFDWSLSTDQMATVVNACGRSDMPVGWLCRALRGLGRRNIGGAGYSGFQSPPPGTRQLVNLTGGHGAGLTPRRLPAVARYVAGVADPFDDTAWTTKPKNLFFNLVSNVAAMLGILAAIAVIAYIAFGIADWPPTAAIVAAVVILLALLLNSF